MGFTKIVDGVSVALTEAEIAEFEAARAIPVPVTVDIRVPKAGRIRIIRDEEDGALEPFASPPQ